MYTALGILVAMYGLWLMSGQAVRALSERRKFTEVAASGIGLTVGGTLCALTAWILPSMS